ncbi:hypothetical protein D3C84_1119220 [compost metagenome]
MPQPHQQALARRRTASQTFQLLQQIRPAQLPGLAQQILCDLPLRIILIHRFGRRRDGLWLDYLHLRAEPRPVSVVHLQGQIHRPVADASAYTQHGFAPAHF